MDLADIIKDYLIAHRYDGLCSEDCGCALDDLFPCDEVHTDCQPGFKCTHEACCSEQDADEVFCGTKPSICSLLKAARAAGSDDKETSDAKRQD